MQRQPQEEEKELQKGEMRFIEKYFLFLII